MYSVCSESACSSSKNELPEFMRDSIYIDSSESELIESEASNIYLQVVDGVYTGCFGSVSISIPIMSNEPSLANIYSISAEYPSDLTVNSENEYVVNSVVQDDGACSWVLWYDALSQYDDYDPNGEPLYSSSALANSYQNSSMADISFEEFVLENRVSNIMIVPLNDEVYDLLNSLGLDYELYGSSILCNYYSPDGQTSNKYNVLQQIDGISVFDMTLFPRGANMNDSPGLFFVSWGEYIGNAGDTGSESLCIAYINNDLDICTIDMHNYTIIDIVEEDLPIKPFEECLQIWFDQMVSSCNGDSLVGTTNTETWIYQADLVYLPVHLIDKVAKTWTDEYYLFPCWIMFYTQINYAFEYPVEIDGVIGLNAVTGENIDINDLEYQRYWG